MLLNGAPAFGGDGDQGIGFSLNESLFDCHQAGIAKFRQVRGKVSVRKSRDPLQEHKVSAGARCECRKDDQPGRFVDESIQPVDVFKSRWQL